MITLGTEVVLLLATSIGTLLSLVGILITRDEYFRNPNVYKRPSEAIKSALPY